MKNSFKSGLYIIIAITALLVSAYNLWINYDYKDEAFEYRTNDTQAMYSEDYFENGQYPDLFLRVLVRDKHVVLAHEPKSYSEYASYGHDDDEGNPFSSEYFKENNFTYWFMCFADSYEFDSSLLTGDAVSENMVPHKADFKDFGIANDMLRYSFPMNHEHVQEATYFWYSWYYHAFAEKVQHRKNPKKRYDLFPNVYIKMDDIKDADNLVALIATNEDLYLMSQRSYDEYLGGKGKNDRDQGDN